MSDGSALNRPRCGLLLTDGCHEPHGREVRSILSEAVTAAGFQTNLLSVGEESSPIQKRIIQDLYRAAVVVCDVSGKSPSVMLALGMRLAFDRPTFIVKDDQTSYSLAGVPIEHLTYPRDLRYAPILDFKRELARRLSALHRAAQTDVQHQTFLEHFGAFSVVHLRERDASKAAVSRDAARVEELRELTAMLRLMRQNPRAAAAQNAGRAGHIVVKAVEFVALYVARHGISALDLERRKPEVMQALEQRLFPHGHFDSLEEWKEFCDVVFAALPAKPAADITQRTRAAR